VKETLAPLVADDLMARATELHERIADAVGPLVDEVRGRGGLIGLKLDQPVAPVLAALRTHGVLAGGAADPHVMRLMPPLVATDDDVARFADALHAALEATAAPVAET